MTARAPKPVDDQPVRGTRKSLVESQIIEVATELFAERGFAGTSLQDIAAAAGLTRPALYHYFASKEDLLSRLVSTVTVDAAGDLRRIRRRRASCADRLAAMAGSIALQQARHPARFRLLVRSEADLPEELSRTYDSGRRSVLREVTTVIEEGVRAGEFRAVDPRTAALGIIGLCNWVAWWHRPGDAAKDERVVAELTGMAVAAVRAADPRPTTKDGVQGALELLRQDVDTLTRLLPDDDARS